MPSTSTPFTLYGGFGSNPFATSTVSAWGNPFQAQWNPMQGSFPSQGMSTGGNPFPEQWNPMHGGLHSQGGSAGGNTAFPFGNNIGGSFLSFNQNQVFTQGYGSSANSSWKPHANFNIGPYFQATNQLVS
jgi:hypothetical protein